MAFWDSWQQGPSATQQQRRPGAANGSADDGLYGFFSGIFDQPGAEQQGKCMEQQRGFLQDEHPAFAAQSSRQQQPATGAAVESFYGFFNTLFSAQENDGGKLSSGVGQVSRNIEVAQKPADPRKQQQQPAQPQICSNQAAVQQGAAAAYVGDPNDLLDQHVAYQLRRNPEAQKRIKVTRKATGVYDINGHEIKVEWQYNEVPGEMGHLVCMDGHARQPFSDYIQKVESPQASRASASSAGYAQPPTRLPAPPPHLPPQVATRPPYQEVEQKLPADGGNAMMSAGLGVGGSMMVSAAGAGVGSSNNSAQVFAAEVDRCMSTKAAMTDADVVKLQQRGLQSATSIATVTATAPRTQTREKVSGYVADKDDLIDQHVAYFLRQHPEIQKRLKISRKQCGVYDLGGREVQMEWQHATMPGAHGHLVVVDGPMRQPFVDYLKRSEDNVQYDDVGLTESVLQRCPMDRRLTFGEHAVHTRLDAMKLAKAQAQFREKAADYVKQGQEVPSDLMSKYQKTLQQKLGPPAQPKGIRNPPAASPAAAAPNPGPPQRHSQGQPQNPQGQSQGPQQGQPQPQGQPQLQAQPQPQGQPQGQLPVPPPAAQMTGSSSPMPGLGRPTTLEQPPTAAPTPVMAFKPAAMAAPMIPVGAPVVQLPLGAPMPQHSSAPNGVWPGMPPQTLLGGRPAGVPCAPGVNPPIQWPMVSVA